MKVLGKESAGLDTIASELDIAAEEEIRRSNPEEQRTQSRLRQFIGRNVLTITLTTAVVLALCIGLMLRYRTWSERQVMYLRFPGDMFLQSLLCVVLPLIISSIISAVGTIDIRVSSKIGGYAIAFYLLSTFLAVFLGIILTSIIRPGKANHPVLDQHTLNLSNLTVVDNILDLIRNLIPPNIVEATIFQHKTNLIPPEPNKILIPLTPENIKKYPNNPQKYLNSSEGIQYFIEIEKALPAIENWKIEMKAVQNANFLGIVFFSVIFGIGVSWMKEEGRPLRNVFLSLNHVMMCITYVIVMFSPVGIFFLIIAKIVEAENFSNVASLLGIYMITVLLGLFIHSAFTLSIIFCVFTRTFPFRLLKAISRALITAFVTSSSAATLPITLTCLESYGIDPRVSNFIVPIGTTINMDGTALYEAVAALFVAQIRNIDITLPQVVAVSITATAASVGAAGIPQAGLVTMVMVFNTIGLPVDDITLILAVDWLLDRFRTVANVYGDCIIAAVIDKRCQKHLETLNMEMVLQAINPNLEPHPQDLQAPAGKIISTRYSVMNYEIRRETHS